MTLDTEASLTDTEMGPPPEIIQRIKLRMGSVKMLPDVAVRALNVARNPDAGVQEFAEVIQQDMKLATDLLAMANSVLYSAGTPVTKLNAAIARIGFRQCKNLIVASSLSSVMKKLSLEEEWIRDVLWRHSVTTGVIATHLNRMFRTGFDGEEFTAGLVHDFGRMLLAVGVPEQFTSIDPLDFDESVDVLARERDVIGIDHCELGAWFARDQGLPDVLQEVLQFHHEPHLSQKCLRLAALTATADHMANHHARSGELAEYDPTDNPGPHFLEQSGIQDAVNRFRLVATELLENAVEDASEMASIQ